MEFVFPIEVRRNLARYESGEGGDIRLRVLEAHGPYPSDWAQRKTLRLLRCHKAAWEAYFDAARHVGLLAGQQGRDVLARLRGRSVQNFDSAMAECAAVWYFAGKNSLEVTPHPVGRSGPLEFLVKVGGVGVNVEVKAPHRDVEYDEDGIASWVGHDSDLILQALRSASKQFPAGKPNLLVLVPRLRVPLHDDRRQVIAALYGENRIFVPTQREESEPYSVFDPNGALFRNTKLSGRFLKSDRMPAHTRVSAVLSIEEVITHDKVDHKTLLMPNPFSKSPLPDGFLKDTIQLVQNGETLEWNDGEDVF